MELFETIAKRHSYRGEFLDKRVPRDDLHKIVQAAIAAPTGCNAQTVSFVIVDKSELIAEIAVLLGGKTVCKTAQAMIVCVCDKTPASRGISFYIEDCAAATQNMLLAVTDLGYATVWLDGAIRGTIASQIGKLLSVPDDKEVRVLLPLGIPKEKGTPNSKKSFDERAWFNGYGKK